MGGYAISVNRFLSLTLSHHSPSVTSTLRPHSFSFRYASLVLRFRSHAFFRLFPPSLSASLRSALCPVGLRRRPTSGSSWESESSMTSSRVS